MYQNGGLFDILTKKNIKKKNFKTRFLHYFDFIFYNSLNTIEQKILLDESFKYLINTKTIISLNNQIKIISYLSKHYLTNKKSFSDLIKSTNLITNKNYSKFRIKSYDSKVKKYTSNLWSLYNKNNTLKKIRKSFKNTENHILTDKNIINIIDIYKNKVYFSKLTTPERHDLYKIIYKYGIDYEKKEIIKNLLKFYIIDNIPFEKIKGIYDLVNGEKISDMLPDEIGDIEYYQDNDKFAKKVWNDISKIIIIPNFNPFYTNETLKRKIKIKEAKEKIQKQKKDENKRAKEAAKKQLEIKKNRKNNKFCKNDIEFITQEDIEDIPTKDLTFIKLNKDIFCLDKDSFKNMIKYGKDQKVRGNCKPQIFNKPLECEWFYPINIGQNIYINEDNYNILKTALNFLDKERKYELKNKRIIDFTTGLHIMSEKSGKDLVYNLVPSEYSINN